MLGTVSDDVTRDARGIPHLRAPDPMALARLQGRVTATDRAWQLEHQRWRMEGRTAEYLGGAGVPWDRFARQVRLEPTARACYGSLGQETRAWVDAYVEGVNEGMPLSLPGAPEMERLGLGSYATRPRPWAPWTPLGIFWAIHVLFGNFPDKLFNAHVIDTMGPDWVGLFDTEVGEGGEGGAEPGSNVWVIGGHRTASGAPMIAGDPHRTIELPGCYQQIGLACDEFDVIGFCFPGVPGVQHFAHTGGVAWGITNAKADYRDLTLEELRPSTGTTGEPGGLEARGSDGWEPVDTSVETILVQDEPPQRIPVVVTARGPVITGLGDLAEGADLGTVAGPGPAAYSLRTPSQVTGDLGFGALLPLLRSRTVDDVAAALTRWVEPVNSAVVADTRGEMRHLVVGRVPRRHADNLVGPVPAWDGRHRWEGWMPNPVTTVTDVMVSANDRAAGGGLGVEYASPFRAMRIRELIGDREGLDVADSATIQVDTLNGQAAPMRELVASVQPAALTPEATAVRSELLAWNGHSGAGSHGAAVFAAWRSAFVLWCSQHEALAPLREPTGRSPLFETWFDLPTQVGAAWASMARRADRHGIDVSTGVREALESAAAQCDPMTVWGDRHWLDPMHALDGVGGAPSASRWPVNGDRGCVLAAWSAPGVTDRCHYGPVVRYVWDLADRDASRWVVPFGAAGSAGDPHCEDQTQDWLAGRLGVTRP